MFNTYQSTKDIENDSRYSGHFFDKDTLRFFKGRVGLDVYGGKYFVTSEQCGTQARRYTVREVTQELNESGYVKVEIKTVGEFQAYATANQAKQAIKNLLASEVK